MKRLLALGLVGLFGVSALAACGSDDKDSTVTAVKNANAAFCTDLTAYGTAVKDLAALDPATATKADYTSAADAVKSSREALVAAGKDLSQAEWTNLEAQAETLNGQLKDAPDDATVSSIVADFNTQVSDGASERRHPEHRRLHDRRCDHHDRVTIGGPATWAPRTCTGWGGIAHSDDAPPEHPPSMHGLQARIACPAIALRETSAPR